MGNDLGFGKPAKKLDLSGFDSKLRVDPEEEADRAAARAGFTSREPVERVMRERKRSREPSDQVFVRAPLSVMNRFKEHCNTTGKSYGEALADLMDKAGI